MLVPSSITTTADISLTEKATAAELKEQIEHCTQAMNGLNLRISDLQEQIDALTTTEEHIAQGQETRTKHIRSLQTEIGQIPLELEDLKIDIAIKGVAATSASVIRRKERQREAKSDLRIAQAGDTRLLREENERLPQRRQGAA